MTMMLRRISTLKGLASIGFLSAAIISIVLGVQAVERSRWAEMGAAVRGLQEEFKARSSDRAVLRGVSEPGDAWDDYLAALAPLDPRMLLQSGSLVRDFLDKQPGVNLQEVEKFVASQRASVEAFRRGTRKSSGQARVDWGNGTGSAYPLNALVALVEARARLQFEFGRNREAMELYLDLAQMGGDVARNGDVHAGLEGLGIQGTAFHGLRELLASGHLAPDDLSEISRELDLLDQSFPESSPALLNDTMGLGLSFLKNPSIEGYRKRFGAHEHEVHVSSWVRRLLLPDQFMMADAILFEVSRVRRAVAADVQRWPAAHQAQTAIDAEFLGAHEKLLRPVYGDSGRGVAQLPEYSRLRRAQLRLLRVAARFQASGEVLELGDPFGGQLLHRTEGSHLKLWSVGPDGVDDGGDGKGARSWRPAPESTQSRDLVLEVGK